MYVLPFHATMSNGGFITRSRRDFKDVDLERVSTEEINREHSGLSRLQGEHKFLIFQPTLECVSGASMQAGIWSK